MPDVVGLYHRFGVQLPDLQDGWASTRCFAGYHRDRHPSARVHLLSGGFRCFACGAAGGVLDALQLLGVWDREEARQIAIDHGILESVRADRRRPRLPGIQRPPVAAPESPVEPADGRVDYDHLPDATSTIFDRTWTYIDEHGTPVGRVRRLDLSDGTKRIWQEHPDHDQWTPGLAGRRLPLYKLPEVLDHAGKGAQVLVVEGEKACDALDRIGFFATTNPGGAGKWQPEHTTSLRGATVLVITDCDFAGRLHATHVTLELLDAGIHVLTPLDPDQPRNDGHDITDHLAEVAATIRAVNPNLDDTDVRNSLHDHLQRWLNRQLPADKTDLQHRVEQANHTAHPDGHKLIDCPRCGHQRVHRLTAGFAYCPCGAKQLAG